MRRVFVDASDKPDPRHYTRSDTQKTFTPDTPKTHESSSPSPLDPGCLALAAILLTFRLVEGVSSKCGRHQRCNDHFTDHCRAAFLARVCTISVLVTKTPGRLPARGAFPARICFGYQYSGFFDRDFGNR